MWLKLKEAASELSDLFRENANRNGIGFMTSPTIATGSTIEKRNEIGTGIVNVNGNATVIGNDPTGTATGKQPPIDGGIDESRTQIEIASKSGTLANGNVIDTDATSARKNANETGAVTAIEASGTGNTTIVLEAMIGIEGGDEKSLHAGKSFAFVCVWVEN